MQRIFFIISCAVLSTIGYGQETIDVFTINKSDKTTLNIEQDLAAFSILKIEHFSNAYASFKRNKATSFQLKLPISKSETITLKLTPQNIYAADFKLIEKSEKGDKIIPFTKPLHFTGTVQGEANSLVGFTITADQLMGVLAYKGSNYNLELQEQYKNTQSYILYRQEDYNHPLDFNCATDAIKSLSLEEGQTVSPTSSSRSMSGSIEVYLECDYQMYLTNNSNIDRTARYATSLFNIVSNIFRRASIDIRISEIAVWNRQDPYGISQNTSGYTVSENFSATRTSFNGQIAQLLTTSRVADVGGLARLGNCSTPAHLNGGLYSFIAGLNNSFDPNLAVYSWDILVMAHELGHNMGSPHTHDCAWNGNNTPIDCCGTSPDGCVCSVGIPRVGTIMSYCHATDGSRIDLSQGFHPQVIRRMQRFAACLAPTGNADCACTNQFSNNICEDFESYRANQYLGPQSRCWTTWSGIDGNREDVYVADNGNKYINIHSNHANGGPQDVVLQLGNRTSGIYDLEFIMYIFEGANGYYNIQHTFNPIQGQHEWASNVYFDKNGDGRLEVRGNTHSFSYPTKQWFRVKQRIDLNQDYTYYYINDYLVHSWRFSDQATTTTRGLKQLSAIDFYPLDNTSNFAIDKISLTKVSNVSTEDSSQSTALIKGSNLEASLSPSITLFPNPATQLLHIALSDFQEEMVTINLRNMLGQIVYEQQIAMLNDVVQIDISNIPTGTYLVQVMDEDGNRAIKKIIKN